MVNSFSIGSLNHSPYPELINFIKRIFVTRRLSVDVENVLFRLLECEQELFQDLFMFYRILHGNFMKHIFFFLDENKSNNTHFNLV